MSRQTGSRNPPGQDGARTSLRPARADSVQQGGAGGAGYPSAPLATTPLGGRDHATDLRRNAQPFSLISLINARLLSSTASLLASLVLAAASRAEDYIYYPRDATETGAGNPRLVVPDADANGGTAQAAVPGQSKPGSYTCALYSYARPAASYRVTWRLKIDDNKIPDAVLKVWTHDEQGRAGYKAGSLEIKGTDFKAPNTYQDFAYPTEKAEGGFFNVGAIWHGKGRVHVDSIKIIPEKLFTEKEIIQRQGKLDLPETWMIPKPTPPVVHMAKGLWWNFFTLTDAMADLGGAVVSSSYHASGQYGMSIRNFPATWEQFMANNLVMLVNVDAQAMGPMGRMLLDEYVQNGGALFVFGGPFSFERGGYKGTALEGLLPCEMTGKDRLKAPGGFVIKPGPGAKEILPDDLSWQAEPRVYYYHEVQPKPGALVLATAGKKPILCAWTVGKGRVAAFAATAEGEAAADQLAFWEWGDSPLLIASVTRWLMQGQGANQAPAKSEETQKLLAELLSPTLGDDNEKREKLIQKLLFRCHDKAFARDLLSAIAGYEGTPDRTFVTATARAVQPFVDASFAKEAGELTDSGDVGKAALGVQIFGACRSPCAQATIVKFLDRGAGALKEIGKNDDLQMDDLMAVAGGADLGADQRLKLAAIIALGDLGDPANLPLLKRETARLEGKPPNPADPTEVADLKENILQQGLAARARLGDGTAVGPFLNELLKNAAKMDEYYNFLDTMLVDKDDKVLMQGRRTATLRLPAYRQRQALCLEMLRQFPYSVYPDVAAELARLNDDTTIPYAYAALAPKDGAKPPPEVAKSLVPLLSDCTVPELRRLAVNLIELSGDADASRTLIANLNKLAASPNVADVTFALRQLALVPPAERTAAVKAALAHADPKVRRLAAASIRLVPEADRKALTPATTK